MPFLPLTKEEMHGPADFVVVTGDAYVDHPSFGHALIARLVESRGFRVAILSNPQSEEDYRRFGEPNYGFLIAGGVVDSMVNNYSVAKRRRKADVYAPGGVLTRPDRAVTVYCKRLRALYPNTAIVIGGIEASLRRFAHYDYWADRVFPTILKDAPADLLVYGMGEVPISELLQKVQRGIPLQKIRDVRGTAYLESFDKLGKATREALARGEIVSVPSFEEVSSDKVAYAKAFRIQQRNTDAVTGKTLAQKTGDKILIVNRPQRLMTQREMDEVYAFPYERNYAPVYQEQGGIKAIEEVKFSLTAQRGCFGSCSFCALTYHQGRVIQNRSADAIVEEAKILTTLPDFKGYIHDVGGPTANFRNVACEKQKTCGVCTERYCIGTKKCPNLSVDHTEYVQLLRRLRELPNVKKVFVRSGVRFDYVMYDKDDTFLRELVKHHISGQLKIAPEHLSDRVLKLMNKPSRQIYLSFAEKYKQLNQRYGKDQYLVPYLISGHPGCTMQDAVELAEYLHSIHYMPEQVQDFYPTPSTRSTTMYYTGLDPDTMQPVYIPTEEEKRLQRALLQYRKKENRALVLEALKRANRLDLVGYGANCLIPPPEKHQAENYGKGQRLTHRPASPTGKHGKEKLNGVTHAERHSEKRKGGKTR